MERATATSRVCISPLTLGARARPSFECLSLCVSLAQREFGLPGRDCRTTKMRERDARAATAANAAQIRLCVKTVIARLAQSPGTGGRICKAEKSKTRDTSDTQFVAVGAVRIERVSAAKFLSIREKNREFCKSEGSPTICPRKNSRGSRRLVANSL